MTACTDDERREAARRLRERASYYESMERDVDFYPVESAIGLKPAGETAYTIESVRSLADLIEPSEPKVKCVAEVKVDGERLEKLVHEAVVEYTGVDRDALLALADDLDYAGANVENVAYIDQTFHDAARSIREACGMDDAGRGFRDMPPHVLRCSKS